jgi:hypothetical protein
MGKNMGECKAKVGSQSFLQLFTPLSKLPTHDNESSTKSTPIPQAPHQTRCSRSIDMTRTSSTSRQIFGMGCPVVFVVVHHLHVGQNTWRCSLR